MSRCDDEADLRGLGELSPFTSEFEDEAFFPEVEGEALSPFVDEVPAIFTGEEEDSSELDERAFRDRELDEAEYDERSFRDREDSEAAAPCNCQKSHALAEFEDEGMFSLVEAAQVRMSIGQGKRDESALTNDVFFKRHPDLVGQKLSKSQTALVNEWLEIRDTIVRPALAASGVSSGASNGSSSTPRITDPDLRETIRMAHRAVPGMPGFTLVSLIEPHRIAQCPEIPISLLLAFMHYESGGKFTDATHGTAKNGYTSPKFYELGIFQTPAGLHGSCKNGDYDSCDHCPPGIEIKGQPSSWARACAALKLDASKWKVPTTQVRAGLYSLQEEKLMVLKRYGSLFPTPGSDWYLRMAFLMPFSKGIGHTLWFLQKYQSELSGLPEAQRWAFLRDKHVTKNGKTRSFMPENVNSKMALAEKVAEYFAKNGNSTASTPTLPAPTPAPVSTPVYVPPASPANGSVPVVSSPPAGVLPGAQPVPASEAYISRLAYISPLGLSHFGGKRDPKKVYSVVVHTTGSGPASLAKKRSKTEGRPAIEYALRVYKNDGVGPHYVIDFDGTIYATCPENYVAWHAGWGVGGYAKYQSYQPSAWWQRVWQKNSPVELLPPGARDPNSLSIGVELLGQLSEAGFTEAQYQSLVKLLVDVERRYGFTFPAPPNVRLLGHEDVAPDKRELPDHSGGWDPGAHRPKPRFSWQKVGALLTQLRSGASFELESHEDPWGRYGEMEADADPWTRHEAYPMQEYDLS